MLPRPAKTLASRIRKPPDYQNNTTSTPGTPSGQKLLGRKWANDSIVKASRQRRAEARGNESTSSADAIETEDRFPGHRAKAKKMTPMRPAAPIPPAVAT